MKQLEDYVYYKTDKGILYCGNCLDILPLLTNSDIDMVFTSPPYNLGNTQHTGNKKHNPYNDDLSEPEYQDQQIKMLDNIYDISYSGTSLVYNHKNRIKLGTQITPYAWLLKSKWNIKQELVWFNRSQNFDKCRFYPFTERIYLLNKGKDKFNNKLSHHDLFNWQPEGTDKKHTRSFPIDMVTDILTCYEFNVCLDPYSGSGTVGLACIRMGKRYIGIEISEQYCEIAKGIIEMELNQTKLF